MRRITLEQACEAIVDCEHKTAPISEDGTHFAVGTPAMKANTIDYTEARRISKETFEAWTRRLSPRHGDLLFAREAPVGPIVQIPPTENVAPGQRTVLMRPDPNLANSRYLYYLLSSPKQQTLLHANAAGSTVAHLNVADVRAFEVELPSWLEQRSIAEILGALDDKIAANTKLAETADRLASHLFLESVRGTPISDQTFADVAKISGGGTPSTKHREYWDGHVDWATPTDVTGLAGPYLEETTRKISEAGLQACSSSLYPAGSILMTSRATIGAFAIAETPMAVNQGFIVVEPKDPMLKFWIFHEMRSRVDEFKAMANGATFQELSRGNFKKFQVRLAEPEPIREFGAKAEALHAAARNAFRENQSLSATRNSLLPHLMSGCLRVKDTSGIIG